MVMSLKPAAVRWVVIAGEAVVLVDNEEFATWGKDALDLGETLLDIRPEIDSLKGGGVYLSGFLNGNRGVVHAGNLAFEAALHKALKVGSATEVQTPYCQSCMGTAVHTGYNQPAPEALRLAGAVPK